jgi:putative ABC transport system ATP-binding protein
MVQPVAMEQTQGLAISADKLEMTFGSGETEVRALRGLSMEIPAGQFLVVRGRSGSGKTTLFHLLAGMRQPTSGRIVIGDTEVHALSEKESARFRRRHVGLIYQFFNLVPILDVTENIALPLLLDGYKLREVKGKAHALMERLDIMHRADHPANKLSGGEMQRVAIARALIGNPGLLLADEPTGNLDEANAGNVLSMISELCREQGITVVMMTHDASATDRCDRMIKLRDGQIEEDLGPF